MAFSSDDTQLYNGFNPATVKSIALSKMKRWLIFYELELLKLNIDTTSVTLLAKPNILNMYLKSMDVGSQKCKSIKFKY